ncbi:MAG: hypothetical protein FWF78_02565 [Defluviitaleaceae bacterium]|nr:hypothetical protein [Defluviitaleaceae bacterium]
MEVRLNPSELAYLGDAVFELLVRDKLLKEGIPFRRVNHEARKFVSASAQSKMYHKIFLILTKEEQVVMKRGRNLHTLSRAKNAGVTEYRHATGLETLFGHLHSIAATDRIHELFRLCADDFSEYLQPCEIIDFDTAEVAALSHELAVSNCKTDFVKAAFEYVRDEIAHTADIGGSIVTCKASEVLRVGQGICYAKSHLLAAILRCGGVPAGICYQSLILDDDTHPYLILHALNAVYVQNKWIRLDARGNKPGVDAQFSLEEEKLAFPVRPHMGEKEFAKIYATPDTNVIHVLKTSENAEILWRNLPTGLSVKIDD